MDIIIENAINFLIAFCVPQWRNYFNKEFAFIKHNSIVEEHTTSHYLDGKMYFNPNDLILDMGSVIVHEYGHFIFDKMFNENEKHIITMSFKEETLSFIEDEKYLVKLHQNYCPSLNLNRFCWDRKFCPVMLTDGIGILKGKSSGLCHRYDYPIKHLATELFAEVLEAEVLGYKIPLAIYKGECPQTYSYIKNKIYEVLKP